MRNEDAVRLAQQELDQEQTLPCFACPGERIHSRTCPRVLARARSIMSDAPPRPGAEK